MTVTELIEFLSAQPGTTSIKTWSPEAGDYLDATGAVFSQDGVLFLQTATDPIVEIRPDDQPSADIYSMCTSQFLATISSIAPLFWMGSKNRKSTVEVRRSETAPAGPSPKTGGG